MNEIFETLKNECEYNDLHGMAIVGNDDTYGIHTVGNYDKICESLYFALCDDKKLLKAVKSAVELASEVPLKS